MNKAPLLTTAIRTNCAEKLLRTISITRMHNSLIDLFVDRTKIEVSLLDSNKEKFLEQLRYNNCQALNDERTIAFNQRFKQRDYVFDEKRQIWISSYIDVEQDDLFIPSGDV